MATPPTLAFYARFLRSDCEPKSPRRQRVYEGQRHPQRKAAALVATHSPQGDGDMDARSGSARRPSPAASWASAWKQGDKVDLCQGNDGVHASVCPRFGCGANACCGSALKSRAGLDRHRSSRSLVSGRARAGQSTLVPTFPLVRPTEMRDHFTTCLRATMPNMLTAIDLFAGAGGLSLGLKEAGFHAVAAVENNSDAVDTYCANVGADTIFDQDIREINFEMFKGVDLVAGGPPCQPFSTGGLRRGKLDDRDMLSEFVRVVLEVGPRAFLLENVPGLAGAAHQQYLRETMMPLWERYNVVGPLVLNAADYGVPQSRRRMIMVGLRDREFRMAQGAVKPVAAGEVLSIGPIGEPNTSKVVYAKNPDLRPNPYHGQLFNGGGRAVDFAKPAPTMLASAGGNKTHFVDVGHQVPPYHSHLMRGGKPRSGELPEARRLTVEECAALQTFPSAMRFSGSRSSQYAQIGNAVPVRFAAAIGNCIAEQIAVPLAPRQPVLS